MRTETSRTKVLLAIVLLALVAALVASVTLGTSPFHIVMISIFAVSGAIIAALFAVAVD